MNDKVVHAFGGLLVVLGAIVALWLAKHYGTGPAVAFATTLASIGVEAYQHVRSEGKPDALDALAGALPGWGYWLGVSL